ncbi:MAG TPA: L,D-transpeptidase family protein [Bacteroidales bacterium]|mgnify:FL=1|nr:L,D-transpeptidase family protein [Bacteroidales bacterium]HNR42483.1 L,D-transpeptidase family protein [Bacteroidales bacterium]HPM19236.1 L,D-transpeptidase family protein [Bacteroidales bacterium]
MGRKKVLSYIFVPVIIVLGCAVLALLLAYLAPRPPVEKVENARITLSRALTFSANIYSADLYRESERFYDSSMVKWSRENERFFLFRNFDEVEKYADLSVEKAKEAIETAKENVISIKTRIEYRIDTLNNIVAHLNKIFTNYPLSTEVREMISKGKLLLKEAEIAFSREEYLHANTKIVDAEHFLTESLNNATGNLEDYFRSYPIWRQWVDKTISDSRRNKSYSIIVDKYARKCHIYYNGIRQHVYDVELGKNWVGHKRIKGDKATPEGMYKVIRKLGSGRTKYYKALLLDYPNEEDKAEFRRDLETGVLPPTAGIGGLIEIHGRGGRGIDWTDGCIALTDWEMDVVFRLAGEGTPVTIVGSMVKLDEIHN